MPSLVLSHFLSDQHRELDHLLASADNALATPEGPAALARFRERMEHHLAIEEQFLFPAIAERMGPGGPVVVMRAEHDSIRGLLRQASEVVKANDREGEARVLDTLTVLIQQHHLKEENVLYPLSDDMLADRAESLIQAMDPAPAHA